MSEIQKWLEELDREESRLEGQAFAVQQNLLALRRLRQYLMLSAEPPAHVLASQPQESHSTA